MTTRPQHFSTKRLVGALCIALSCVATGGCGARTAAKPVLGAHQLGDLYWNGAFNDSKANRWDVAILPGIAPTGTVIANSYQRSWGYLKNTGSSGMDGGEGFTREAFRYAFKTDLDHYVARGIGRDYSGASNDLRELWTEKPFAWIPVAVHKSVWGFIVKPVARLISGSVAATGGIVAGTACGAVEGTGRGVLAVGDIAVMGTAYPAARIAWQQPTFLLALGNAEPDIGMDGRWGLRIIDSAQANRDSKPDNL